MTRVLVVDDDALVRRSIGNVLARAGFEVSTANDGAIAIRLAELTPPEIVVVDLNMPMSGIDVARVLKQKYGAGMFVAICTGDDDPEVREECLAAGADAVLLKPMPPGELRRRLVAAAEALAPTTVTSAAS